MTRPDSKCPYLNEHVDGYVFMSMSNCKAHMQEYRIRREQEGKDSLTRSSGGRNANQMQVSINSTSVQYWSDIVTLLLNFECCLHISNMCD